MEQQIDPEKSIDDLKDLSLALDQIILIMRGIKDVGEKFSIQLKD